MTVGVFFLGQGLQRNKRNSAVAGAVAHKGLIE